MGGTLKKVDIGLGRGWLAPKPAASLARIDAELIRLRGRPADINEAGRSPEQANENRARWLAYERYLKGGPWAPKAPYALGADESVHCQGGAADSDDWYDERAAAVWRDHGWRQTARYPGNKAKDEPWHGEHFEHLDNHRNDPVPTGAKTKEEDAMFPAVTFSTAKPSGKFYLYDLRTGKVIRGISKAENDAFRAAEQRGMCIYVPLPAGEFAKAGGKA